MDRRFLFGERLGHAASACAQAFTIRGRNLKHAA